MRQDVRNKLINVARGRHTITYGELMKEFHINRRWIGGIVGRISEDEHKKGRPRLSAIVVRARSETNVCPLGTPGGGFFGIPDLPAFIKREESEFTNKLSIQEQQFIAEEQKKAWEYWQSHDDNDSGR